VAAGLRLARLDSVPPALSADEASNAYDGYCLLKTHCDRWGQPWPVVLRAFGDADYRPALMAYLTLPFQVLLGPQRIVTAARLPAALGGVLAVLCLYDFVRRAFGRRAGLIAATLLAVCPWHLMLSRLGHESALTPGWAVLTLWLLQRAGLLQNTASDSETAPPGLRWIWSAAAGAAIGLSPYTYASMKLFVPALLAGIVLIYRRPLVAHLRTRTSRRALGVMVVVAVVVAGPMIRLTLTDWDRVNARARSESLFHREPTLGAALSLTLRQYAAHFGPGWLLLKGHPYADQSLRGFGQFDASMLLFALPGLIFLVRDVRRNRACGVVLLWLLIYPIASATTHGGVNAARAACGVAMFPVIAGVGLAGLLDRLQPLRRVRTALAALCAAAVLAGAVRLTHAYFVVFPRDAEVQARYQAEFRLAMDYLRPRRDLFDQVFITDRRSMSRNWHTSEAYIFPAVYLPIEPEDFRAMPKVEWNPPGGMGFHFMARCGDFTFSINNRALDEYAAAFPSGRILLIARLGEVEGGRVVATIDRPVPATSQSAAGATEPALVLIAADLARERPRAVWDEQEFRHSRSR